MGNCCSTSDPSPFNQPGRVLSSAPPKPNAPTAPAPKSNVPRKIGGPARTLGSGSSAGGRNGSSTQEDARRKAAEAAEARLLAAKKPKGTLGKKLQGEQSQTLETTRKNASAVERAKRDADAAADARAYN
ncbi:hypothetical protein DSL72_003322 [Monilinia vaccinii-corymbosi]|uniref:Uncharacterized protein n=1 Tax=Monilinia vaccinii-corymbosi TaxID=61207 RepID=A0A8A3P8W7_9HELO|nr:hypothetical protein DSL72_003322 [Monilinia vaccinii-corymbosi]